jgi:hypothetical protein
VANVRAAGRGDGGGQDDREGRTFTRPASHRDVAAEQLAEPPGNRQAKTGAAVLFGRRGLGLAERLEQAAELLLGHADAGVRDGKSHHRAIALEALRHHGETAILSELAAIAQNVKQALLELGAISADATEAFRQTELERIAVLLGERNDERANLFEQRDLLLGEPDLVALGVEKPAV